MRGLNAALASRALVQGRPAYIPRDKGSVSLEVCCWGRWEHVWGISACQLLSLCTLECEPREARVCVLAQMALMKDRNLGSL